MISCLNRFVRTRTHFTFRIDLWTADGENIVEQLAGVEDFQLALATYRAAVERRPGGTITLRQGARVIEDSRRTRTASWSKRVVARAGAKRCAFAGGFVGRNRPYFLSY